MCPSRWAKRWTCPLVSWMDDKDLAAIKPFRYDDPETGDTISVAVSDLYTTLRVNDREYFFARETGEFDGTATVRHEGPILVYVAE
jgi:hypothetical protein